MKKTEGLVNKGWTTDSLKEEKMKFRKCFVLRQVEIDMKDLKKGDIFRLTKAAPDDCVNENEYSIAEGDSYPEKEEGNHGVKCVPIQFLRVPSVVFPLYKGVEDRKNETQDKN